MLPRRSLCCSSLFMRRWFRMWRLCCHCLFLISPSLGASGRLCFLILTFPGYLHIYFCQLYQSRILHKHALMDYITKSICYIWSVAAKTRYVKEMYRKIVSVFLRKYSYMLRVLIVPRVIHESICCGYSLEALPRSASNEYLQHMHSWSNKKKRHYIMVDTYFIKSDGFEVRTSQRCVNVITSVIIRLRLPEYAPHQIKQCVFEHNQNVRTLIMLLMCKVSSGHLLSIKTVYSIQCFWLRTTKTPNRLRGRAG